MRLFKTGLLGLLLLTIFSCSSSAQSYIDNLKKYWNYRYRLIGDAIDPTYWDVSGFFSRGSVSLPQVGDSAETNAEDEVKNGIDVGKMDATLLKKIEELTLYVLELKREMTSLNPSEGGTLTANSKKSREKN